MGVMKEDRIAVRLTADQSALIRQAAEAEGLSVTDFVVTTSTARAHNVLADRRVFVMEDAAWTEFQAVLDAPPVFHPKLSKMFSTPAFEVAEDGGVYL